MEEKQYDFFICYTHQDRQTAKKIAEALEASGLRVWFDQWEIHPGTHVLLQVNHGMENAEKMLACWTPDFFANPFCLQEIAAWLHADIYQRTNTINPVMLEDCPYIPKIFSNLFYVPYDGNGDFSKIIKKEWSNEGITGD